MKIAFLGTRGVPNIYGGFEQFAQHLSVELVKKGHAVTVYTPSYHPIEIEDFHGVTVKSIYHPEKKLGPVANLIYDTISFKNAFANKYDLVIECGYASSFLAKCFLYNTHTKIITNMDGLEWKRKKWNSITSRFIRFTEKTSSYYSNKLIVDNNALLQYYPHQKEKTICIPYGANTTANYDQTVLDSIHLKQNKYILSIARFEPENNLNLIIDAFLKSGRKEKLVIVCNKTKYGKKIMNKYKDYDSILFITNIYNIEFLDSLRNYSLAYIHGHSAGGTNPSLLEAMASEAFVIAFNNEFNKSVLENSAYYFSSSEELLDQFKNLETLITNKNLFVENNMEKIKTEYSWERIVNEYETILSNL